MADPAARERSGAGAEPPGGAPRRRKRVLVVCGTGIATSTYVASRLRDICRRRGIDAEIVQALIQEVPAYADRVDLVVATTQVPYPVPVPVESGIPFLTGVGEEHLADRIVQELQKKEA
jgi:galactitol PTS system EIIB component